jgi:hypothetical protein
MKEGFATARCQCLQKARLTVASRLHMLAHRTENPSAVPAHIAAAHALAGIARDLADQPRERL